MEEPDHYFLPKGTLFVVGPAVRGEDDATYASDPAGERPEAASLGAVRVKHIRPKVPNDAHEVLEGLPLALKTNVALHGRNDRGSNARVSKARGKGSGSTRNHEHFVARSLRRNRYVIDVALGAAPVCLRDHIEHPEGVVGGSYFPRACHVL